MTVTDDLLRANEEFARTMTQGNLEAPPRRRVAVLTCMDARLDPAAFLGLELGDAHVIRNAGGRASDDAIRSLIISSHLLGTREYLVIHHTQCGMLGLDTADLRERLRKESGVSAEYMNFLGFSDLEGSVRDDVRRIKRDPFIPAEVVVRGFVYDVRTGRLHEVDDETGRLS